MRLTASTPRPNAGTVTLANAYPARDSARDPGSGGGSSGGFSALGSPPSPDAQRTALLYEGRLGELYRIFLVNLLLTFLTGGLYRFWAKTRLRRYLWSHTSLSGDRFEYTGTGAEMFFGFVIVMVFIVLAQIGMYALAIGSQPGDPIFTVVQFCGGTIILYITFVAQYAAQRYRLTRTLWRGISGGMTGSAWVWGLKGMFFSVLSLLTMTLAWPWAQMRLVDDRINNSFFGDAKASAHTSSKSLYVAYLVGLVIAAVLSVVAISIISGLIGLMVTKLGLPDQLNLDPANKLKIPPELIGIILLGAVAFFFAFWTITIVAFSFYQAAMIREIAAKLSLGGLRFATSVTAGALMRRIFGNIFIVLVTLGFGIPIAIHRTMRFIVTNVEVVGNVDGSEISRAHLKRPRMGEGLLEAFDPGFL